MRYSSRPKNIVWKQQVELQQALEMIRQILNEHEARVELKLQSGQGVLTNNVLHGRTAFSDGERPRLIRAASQRQQKGLVLQELRRLFEREDVSPPDR